MKLNVFQHIDTNLGLLRHHGYSSIPTTNMGRMGDSLQQLGSAQLSGGDVHGRPPDPDMEIRGRTSRDVRNGCPGSLTRGARTWPHPSGKEQGLL